MTEFSDQLQRETMGCRLHCSKFGLTKSLEKEQKAQAAEPFGAGENTLNASKVLLDRKSAELKDVLKTQTAARKFWSGITVPYPDDGVRLIRRDSIATFDAEMQIKQNEHQAFVLALEDVYGELIQESKDRMGTLWNRADYPESIANQFSLSWDYVDVNPPQSLMQLHPEIFQKETERVHARFEEAVRLTEEAFTQEFSKLVSKMVDRMEPQPDGSKKVFRNTTIENFQEFFEQFRVLSVRSNPELDRLVDTAKQAVEGVTAQDLRGSENLHSSVSSRFTDIGNQLEDMLENAKGRRFRFEEDEDGKQEVDHTSAA